MSTVSEHFESWAIIDLFGHKRIAGKVTEANIGGGAFIRVDIPDAQGRIVLTKYVSPAAVYDITPCDENVAVAAARNFDVAPIRKFELKQLAGPGSLGFDESEDNRDY